MLFTSEQQLVSFVTTQKLPEWQTKLFCKYRDQIQVHSKGLLFHKIDTLFPNENPESKANRLLSFEPITKGSYNKGVSNIFRIFNNSSYSCQASENTVNKILENNFNNKNLFAYFLDLWVDSSLKQDPNSLIVIYPDKFMEGKTFDQVISIPSEHIVYFDDDTFIFKSEEESKVERKMSAVQSTSTWFYDHSIARPNVAESARNIYNEKIDLIWQRTVYHAFVQNKLFRIEQQEDANQYEVTEFDLGANTLPPVIQSGGVLADRNVYECFLSPFIYFGNLALLQHSQHTAVNFTFSFPRMSEVQPVCDYPTCNNGWISCDITDLNPTGQTSCPSCKGTGYKAVQSPYKVYVKRYNPNGLEDNESLNVDDVRYYSPDVAILDYSKNEWRNYLKAAETAIFIQQQVYTGNVQSAESKDIDLEELYAFLISVSKVFYDRVRFVIQAFENYLNSRPVNVSITIPYSFAILTEQEAFLALNNILSSNAPSLIKGNQVDNFISKFISDNSPVKKAYQVLKQVDLLFLKNDNEINLLKSNNIVSADQWAIHTWAYPLLVRMYETDKTIFEKEVKDIAATLNTELSNYKSVPTDLKTTLQQTFAQ